MMRPSELDLNPDKKQRCVYLDIEGPLVTAGTKAANTIPGELFYRADPVLEWALFVDRTCVSLVLRLCELIDAKLVITSSLRQDRHFITLLEHKCFPRRYTERDRPSGMFHEQRVTPNIGTRETEIQKHIDDNGIDEWVIIDDMFVQLPNLIHVDSRFGFTVADFDNARKLFWPEGVPFNPSGLY